MGTFKVALEIVTGTRWKARVRRRWFGSIVMSVIEGIGVIGDLR